MLNRSWSLTIVAICPSGICVRLLIVGMVCLAYADNADGRRLVRPFAAWRLGHCARPISCCSQGPSSGVVVRCPAATNDTAELPSTQAAWTDLFDGQSLSGWKAIDFGGQGDVRIEDGQIVLEMGDSMTGITYERPVPIANYEIRLEAMRVEGNDFFCGLTFPVDRSHCSFIVGGWAGAVVGLSSIDGFDASENETTTYRSFQNQQWYRIRVRVRNEKIEAWIDDEQVVDQSIVGRKISTRPEVDLSKPLGLATWETTAAVRNIQLRELANE